MIEVGMLSKKALISLIFGCLVKLWYNKTAVRNTPNRALNEHTFFMVTG